MLPFFLPEVPEFSVVGHFQIYWPGQGKQVLIRYLQGYSIKLSFEEVLK